MRHVLETYKVFEQGKLLDAVIHIVINFLHAGQFVRFSLILCQLYFSIFRKISPWPHHSQALHIHQSCQGLEGVVIWLFDWFSSARHVSVELRYFSLARTRNIGHIPAYWPTVKHPPYPHLTGKYGFSFVSVPTGSASSWSASNPDSGVPRFFSSFTAQYTSSVSTARMSWAGPEPRERPTFLFIEVN